MPTDAESLKEEEARYADLLERGPLALSDYDRKMNSPGSWDEFTDEGDVKGLAMALFLVGNHILYYRGKQAEGLGRWCDGTDKSNGNRNNDECGDDDTPYLKAERLARSICESLRKGKDEGQLPE